MCHSSSLQCLTDQATSSSSQSQLVGFLQEKDVSGKLVNSPSAILVLVVNHLTSNQGRRLFADQELTIGRDGNRCQYVLDDPVVSNRHVRLYSVVYDSDQPRDVFPLVYAEDLSRNGTFWNSSLIGKGNGGFLLSDKDTLRVSARTIFVYRMILPHQRDESFDSVQEHEMKVGPLSNTGKYAKTSKHFYNDYIVTDRVLGAGAYGRVYMAIEQSRRTQLACKFVDLRKLQTPSRIKFGRWERPAAAEDVDSRLQLVKVKSWGQKQKKDNQLEEKLKTYYREAEILASLNHPNVIGLEKVYLTNNSIYIFQDLVTAGDLFSYIELKNGKLLDVEAAVIVRQILVALEFLHKKNIVHRDLKPENILMTTLASGCRVVLTDFGCARRLDHERRRMLTCMGTYEYIAPEMPHEQNSAATAKGYTKAVDLWSLGCVTVVLLTGGYPFFEPGSSAYSESLASTCNLEALEKSQAWGDVGARPKAFVKRLLVLDERLRMTATESLRHEWFTNDIHRTDFEALYQRATRHWRPRMPKEPVIELIDADSLKSLPFLQGMSPNSPKSRRRGPLPIDPPYKPFPRRLHNLAFFPKRSTSPFNDTMSDDVKGAIESNWSFDNICTAGPSLAEDERPTPCASEVGKEGANSWKDKLQDRSLVLSPTSFPTLSRKSRFQAFRANSSSTCTDIMKASEDNGKESKYVGNEPYSIESDETDKAPVRKAYSPTAWKKEAEAISSTPNSKAKLKLPNRRGTPRPPRTLVKSNSGTDLPLSLGKNASKLPGSHFFVDQVSPEEVGQTDQPAICVNEDSPLDSHSLRYASVDASADQQKRIDPPKNSPPETIHDETVLNSDSNVNFEYRHSSASYFGAVSVHEDASLDAVRQVTATTGLRLKSLAQAIGDILGIHSSNIKKRRRQSIFDFEEDFTASALRQSKKTRFDQENVKLSGKPRSIEATFPQTKPKSGYAGSTGMEVEKTLGQASHDDDLHLPRI